MAMTGFICHDAYLDKLSKLSDEEVGRLFRALMRYHVTGEAEELEGRESIAYDFIKDDIDRADEAYRKKCDQNRENRKGAITNDNDRQQTSTDVNDCDHNKNNNKNKNNTPNGVNKGRFTPPSLEEVEQYCKERNNGINPQNFVDFYASKGWKVGNTPMKDWKACVRTWERRDNDRPSCTQKQVVAQNYHQRTYTEEQLRSSAADDLLKEAERLSREGIV